MRKEYELKFKTVGTDSKEIIELTHYQEVYTDKDLSDNQSFEGKAIGVYKPL